MAKNKLIELVFSNIFNRKDKVNKPEEFLISDIFLNIPNNNDLYEFKQYYYLLVDKITADINMLADLEEIISQIRCREIGANDFKLSITGNFIYAKAVFYRNTNKSKDIRVIAGRVDEFLPDGKSLQDLYDDKSFSAATVCKLKNQMTKEINKLIPTLKEKLEKYEIFAHS